MRIKLRRFRQRIINTGEDTANIESAILLKAVSRTAFWPQTFDLPTELVRSWESNTSIPFSTPAYLIQVVLQNPAFPEAKDPTKAFRTRSLLPEALLESPAVSFLKLIPTIKAEDTA